MVSSKFSKPVVWSSCYSINATLHSHTHTHTHQLQCVIESWKRAASVKSTDLKGYNQQFAPSSAEYTPFLKNRKQIVWVQYGAQSGAESHTSSSLHGQRRSDTPKGLEWMESTSRCVSSVMSQAADIKRRPKAVAPSPLSAAAPHCNYKCSSFWLLALECLDHWHSETEAFIWREVVVLRKTFILRE